MTGAGSWTLTLVILAAAVVSDAWRVLGAVISTRIDEGSATYRLVKCIATALIAAIVSKLVLYPAGSLAEIAPWLRVGAPAAGFAAYLAARRSMVVGTLVCEVVLGLGVALTG
jgi:hypothetical protein